MQTGTPTPRTQGARDKPVRPVPEDDGGTMLRRAGPEKNRAMASAVKLESPGSPGSPGSPARVFPGGPCCMSAAFLLYCRVVESDTYRHKEKP